MDDLPAPMSPRRTSLTCGSEKTCSQRQERNSVCAPLPLVHVAKLLRNRIYSHTVYLKGGGQEIGQAAGICKGP